MRYAITSWRMLAICGCASLTCAESGPSVPVDAGSDPCEGVIEADPPGIPCDPVDGSRCDINARLSCVWELEEDRGRCRCLRAQGLRGEPCDLDVPSCAPGLGCLQLGGDLEPVCYKVCTVPDGAGCEGLEAADPANAYACLPLGRSDDSATEDHGACFAVGPPCDPLNDTCPSNQTCTLRGRATGCRALGVAAVGESCELGGCQRGGICVPLNGPNGERIEPRCYLPCDPTAGACPEGFCLDIGLSFGLCV